MAVISDPYFYAATDISTMMPGGRITTDNIIIIIAIVIIPIIIIVATSISFGIIFCLWYKGLCCWKT